MKARALQLGVVLAHFMLCIWFFEIPVHSYETAYDSGTNHYEWPNICIYANDIYFSVDEAQALVEVGDFEETVIKNAQVQIRTAPDYQLQTRTISIGDISDFNSETVVAGVYACTLYTDSNREHSFIKINMYIEENEMTKVKWENGEHEEHYSDAKGNKYHVATMLMAVSFLIIIVQTVIAVPKIKILCWYSKK